MTDGIEGDVTWFVRGKIVKIIANARNCSRVWFFLDNKGYKEHFREGASARVKRSPKPKRKWETYRGQKTFFIIIYLFISFAIPKYNNYNYYHKTYMHKLTTHLSTRAIPQLHTR